MNENYRSTVKIAIRCLKETKCYLEYLKEIKIDTDRWKSLANYLGYVISLYSDEREYALESLLMRTIAFSNTAKGATYWCLKNYEFERKYESLANLYYYGLELDSFVDSWFTRLGNHSAKLHD